MAQLRGRRVRHPGWVDWFNNRRLLEPIENIPPAEAEQRYYAMLDKQHLRRGLRLQIAALSDDSSELDDGHAMHADRRIAAPDVLRRRRSWSSRAGPAMS
jgi:hypothetical protein